MKYLSLMICTVALLLAGCKKKDEFKLEVESTAFGTPTEVSSSGISGLKLRLKDVANGFGETVKITVEGLPSELKVSMRPDSSVVVTDAGIEVYVDITAKNVPVNQTYTITFRFSWGGGSLTRDAALRIVPYNAAKALAGNYSGSSNCDSNTNGGFEMHTALVVIDTGISRIKIRNFANLGEEVYVAAIIDSVRKRVTIPQQYFYNYIGVSGDGTYTKTNMNLTCNLRYATTTRSYCNVTMNIMQQ